MGDKHVGGLNGAYYGPPVPPRRAAYSAGRGSSSSCCCCNPFYCLCSCLFKLIFTIVIIVGILVLVLWLLFRPHELKAHVETATLTTFALTNNTLLTYNLSLALSIRNPNERVGFHFDRLDATATYDGYRFGYDEKLPAFFQDHKNTTLLHPVFVGSQAVGDGGVVANFEKEKTEGFFHVDVNLNAKVRFKVWFIKTTKYSPKIYCRIKLPVPASASASASANQDATFTRTRCDVTFF